MSGSVQASHSVTSNHVRFIHILFPHPSHAASSIQAALELLQARGSLFSAVPCYRQKDSRNAETSNRKSDLDKSRYELVSHIRKCVSRAPNWNKQPFANDRKMSWEGHSISVNHGRQITSLQESSPFEETKKATPTPNACLRHAFFNARRQWRRSRKANDGGAVLARQTSL